MGAVAAPLKARLDRLVGQVDVDARIAADPVRFPRRYTALRDVEVAGVLAALLAFGRVDLFGPVAERLFVEMDKRGGPARWVESYDADARGQIADVYYRWIRVGELDALFRMLQAVYRRHASLGELWRPGPAEASLGGAIDALRGFAPVGTSRAFASWLPHPGSGSACKRWCMFTRWMVRRDTIDLGVWTHLSPRDLVIPLDTHVFRVSHFLGLTTRATPGWRAAVEITTSLARLDPADPVRYDFALAHLGISGQCRGARDATICPSCPLDPVCTAPTGSSPATRGTAAPTARGAGRARRGKA